MESNVCPTLALLGQGSNKGWRFCSTTSAVVGVCASVSCCVCQVCHVKGRSWPVRAWPADKMCCILAP